MNPHEQFAEDLALYALGTLTGSERPALEAHLRECSACREELERLRGDMALLAFSTSGPRPPARSKERLLAAIGNEPKLVARKREPKRAWWGALEWAAAAAVVIVVVLLVRQNSELRERLARAQSGSAAQQQQLQEAKQLLSTLTSPDADRFVLVQSKTPPQPQGRAIYLANSGTVVFLASHMPELPPEKAYELWLIPASGAPIPAGVFRPNAEGSAAVIKPAIPLGVQAKTFAITVESKDGSPTPTSQPLMVGERG
jgi:anti-sigma-K factor RskA